MAVALYRRYRPDVFQDVIGQDQTTIPLMRAQPSSNMVVVEAHLLQGPVKFPSRPWLHFGPSRFFLPRHQHKNWLIWGRGSLGLFPAKSLCTGADRGVRASP